MPQEFGRDERAAVVLGLDSHGLAVARALSEAGVEVHAIEQNPSLPGVVTNSVRKVTYVPSFQEPHLVQALLALRISLSRYQSIALLAINDRQVELIGKHLTLLQPSYRIAWAHCASTVLQLQSKDSLQAVCERQGLRYPRSLVVKDVATPNELRELEFPIILKPVKPLSSFKTLLAQDASEFQRHVEAYKKDLPILVQEYIAGDDRQIYFGALMLDHGRVVSGLVGRKIESYPRARGQTTIAETTDCPEVLNLTENFFAGMGLSGPVSLELKRDPQGRWWVIEPTVGRSDFWAPLCIAAGFNQPLMELELALGLPLSPPAGVRGAVWYDAERDPTSWLRLCWKTMSLRPFGKSQSFPYFDFSDARPFARALSNLGRRIALYALKRG